MSISDYNNKKRSHFNLSHEVKLSCDLANIVPILCDPVTPGDTFKVQTDVLVRFAPLLAPLMHQVDVFVHYFFVPDRLVHEDFESFITGGEHGDDATESPFVISTQGEEGTHNFSLGSLPDYLGMPVDVAGIQVDAKPFRGYYLILNEFFRQQDLQEPYPVSLASGQDTTTLVSIQQRNWNKDYFTRALPFQQKGEAVALPLAGNAPVRGLGIKFNAPTTTGPVAVCETGKKSLTYKSGYAFQAGTTTQNILYTANDPGDRQYPYIYADMSGVSSATVNDLRKAFQLQRHLERNMRCGARLTEYIQANFGVHNKDYRLQRPEFLGGGRSHVVFSEVLQTSSTDDTSPQGNMAGHGFGSLKKAKFVKSFTEYGFVFGLMSVMPKSSYNSNGLDRKFTRFTKYDYIIPDFVHLGEQAIKNKELFVTGDVLVDDRVFGWVPYYDDERRRLSRVCGEFRSTYDYWHLARQFDTTPDLNDSFLKCVPRTDIYAEVATSQKLRVYIYHHYWVVRMLPKYGTPGYIDH